jgi:hypothetical protein
VGRIGHRVKLVVDWIEETVDRDRQMYGLTDAKFGLLKDALRDNPRAGDSKDNVNFEFLFGGLMVHYLLKVEPQHVLVLITGVRPPATVSRSKEVGNILRQAAILLRAIKGLGGMFGGGE